MLFPAALVIVLLLAPTGNSLECWSCDSAECNDKFPDKITCGAPPTGPPTEAPTTPVTEAPTTPPTEPPTKPPTEPPTKPPTEAPTQPPTEPPTKPPTEAPTKPPTEPPTKPPTEAPTKPPTEAPTKPPTEATTKPPTEPPTKPPTKPPTAPTTITLTDSLRSQYRRENMFSVRRLKAETEDEYRCIKVVYKDGEDKKTKRGCLKLEEGDNNDKDICKKFLDKEKDINGCGVCKKELCNSAGFYQLSKGLFFLILLPLIRFF